MLVLPVTALVAFVVWKLTKGRKGRKWVTTGAALGTLALLITLGYPSGTGASSDSPGTPVIQSADH